MPNDELSKIVQRLLLARHITIFTHKRPDADAIGSSLALARALRTADLKAAVVSYDVVPSSLMFLPEVETIESNGIDHATDLFVALDIGNPTQISPDLYEAVKSNGAPILVVDHHGNNPKFGEENFIDDERSSTAELIFSLIKELGVTLDSEIATCLLAGIIFDTRGFSTRDTTRKTLRDTMTLMEAGASLFDVKRAYDGQHRAEAYRLWGRALMALEQDRFLAWAVITKDMYAASTTTHEDVTGLAAFLLTVRGVKTSFVFTEKGNGSVKVSGRAVPNINLIPLAETFPGGGGHEGAVGFELDASISDSVEQVISKFWSLYPEGLSSSRLRLSQLIPESVSKR